MGAIDPRISTAISYRWSLTENYGNVVDLTIGTTSLRSNSR